MPDEQNFEYIPGPRAGQLRAGLQRLRYLVDGLFLGPGGGVAPEGTLKDASGLVDALVDIAENRLGFSSSTFGRPRVNLFPNEPIADRPKKIIDAPGQRGGLVAVPSGESPQSQRMNVQNAASPVRISNAETAAMAKAADQLSIFDKERGRLL